MLDILLALRADSDTRMSALLGDEDVVTVNPHTKAAEVAGQLVEARRHSLVVVDEDELPIGRILADDVLDALVPTEGRFHFPRLLSVRAAATRRTWLVYLAAAGPGLVAAAAGNDAGGIVTYSSAGRAVRLPHPVPDGADHRRLCRRPGDGGPRLGRAHGQGARPR